MKTSIQIFIQKTNWQFTLLSFLLLFGNSLFGQFTAGQEFFIQAKHSSLYLEVPNQSRDNGTVLIQNHKTGQDNQIFRLQNAGEGYFHLVAKHSGKAIDVSGVSSENGAMIHQWEIWGNDNQKFKLQDVGGGYVNIVAKHSGKALDVSGVSSAPGAKIHQWETWGGENQKFKFIPAANQPDAIVSESSSIWSINNINVCWEDDNPAFTQHRQWVKDAVLGTWCDKADINFTGWGTCNNNSQGIRIQVDDNEDNSPHTKGLGSDLNGKKNGMVLNFELRNWGSSWRENHGLEKAIKIIGIHEFGHALGIAHEHNRDDCACWIEPQGTVGDTYVTPCDKESVMNYCYNADRDNYLSAYDIVGIQKMYGPKKREKMAQVVVFNQGGYNARFTIVSQAPGEGILPTLEQSRMLQVGQSQSFSIPVDHTVKVKAEYWDGFNYQFIDEIRGVTFRAENDKKTFKTYGAMWDAKLVSEGPMDNSKPTFKLTLLCNGAFSGNFEITYNDGGDVVRKETGGMAVGQSKSYWITANTPVTVKGQFHSFVWHTVHNDGLQTINLNKDITVGLEGTTFSASMVQY